MSKSLKESTPTEIPCLYLYNDLLNHSFEENSESHPFVNLRSTTNNVEKDAKKFQKMEILIRMRFEHQDGHLFLLKRKNIH